MPSILNTIIENITNDVITELTSVVKQEKLKSIDLSIQTLQQRIKQYNSQKTEINSSTDNTNKTEKIKILDTKIKKAQDKITQLQKNRSTILSTQTQN